MLVWEGILYTVGVVLLTLTVGLGIIYSIYQSVNYMGAEFWFPTIPFLGAVVICWVYVLWYHCFLMEDLRRVEVW